MKTPKRTKQNSKLNFIFIINPKLTKFMWKVDILLYFMSVKYGTVSFNRRLKIGFNLVAGITNLLSYESAFFARCSVIERRKVFFNEISNALVNNKP